MLAVSKALHDLLATARLSAPARNAVLRRMGLPRRHYHGLGHLAVLWTRHRRFSVGTPYRAARANRLIACAIAFHDTVYDVLRRDNEHRSALLWRRYAPPDLSRAEVAWVAATIEATANHLAQHGDTTAAERLRLWVLDLDLTPLGESAVSFRRATRLLRAESRHVPEPVWNANRLAFLRKMQTAPALYRCPRLAAAFEEPARRNIAREVG